MTTNPLFSNLTINNHPFHNRLVVAPMTRITAEEDGRASETMKRYYERYAKGGFGAVISEGIYPDQSYSQGYYNQPGLATQEHVQSWKPVVEAVHAHDTLFIAQLMHAGAQSQGNRYKDETIAPSDVAAKGEQLGFYGGSGPFPTPKAMTEEDIADAKESFIQSALNAKEAGFDGVELHGANGYLLDQFLTDYMNQREDQYGGSVENRLRLLVELVEQVREAVGEDYIVGIRISQIKVADPDHKWAGGEQEAEQIFSKLGELPLDYIHVTDGDATNASFGEGTRTLSQAAKDFGKLPVIANGKLGDPEKAGQFLQDNQADLVSLGTSALANPDFPNRVKQGEELRSFNFEATLLPQAEIKDHEINIELIQK